MPDENDTLEGRRRRGGALLSVVLAAFLLPVSGLATINYLVDPYQYFRLRSPDAPGFLEQARFQNPSLIRHLDYDTLLVGSSLSENFRPSYFDDAGWKFRPDDLAAHRTAITVKAILGDLDRIVAQFSYLLNKLSVLLAKFSVLLFEFCDPSPQELFPGRFHRPLHVELSRTLSDAKAPPLESSWRSCSQDSTGCVFYGLN